MEEKFGLEVGLKHKRHKAGEVRWAERDIYAAFLAMADADSSIIDPHKMGIVLCPAGIVAFRNGPVTEHIVERAQSISDNAGGIKSIDQSVRIDVVGAYIVQGSKPGGHRRWPAGWPTRPSRSTSTATDRSCAPRS